MILVNSIPIDDLPVTRSDVHIFRFATMPPKPKSIVATKKKPKAGAKNSDVKKTDAKRANESTGNGAPDRARNDSMARLKELELEMVKAKESEQCARLDKDKLGKLLEETKTHLQSAKEHATETKRELEQVKEERDMQLSLHAQKLKHIEHRRLEDASGLREDYDQQEAQSRRECEANLIDNYQAVLNLESKIRCITEEHERAKRGLKLEHTFKLREERQFFERRASERVQNIEKEAVQIMNGYKQAVESQISKIESQYAVYNQEIISAYTNAFQQLKEFFNELTDAHVSEIETLKKGLSDASVLLTKQAVEMKELKERNASLAGPFADAQRKLSRMQMRLSQADQKNKHLHYAERALKLSQKHLRDAKWENELLIQRIDGLMNNSECGDRVQLDGLLFSCQKRVH